MTIKNKVVLDKDDRYVIEIPTSRDSYILYFCGGYDLGRMLDTILDRKEKESNITVFGSFVGPVIAVHSAEVPEDEFFEAKLRGTVNQYRSKTSRAKVGAYYEMYLYMNDGPYEYKSPCSYQSYIDFCNYDSAAREYGFGRHYT